MKNLFLLLAISFTFLISSCEGPPGPPGPPGDSLLGQVFEANVTFTIGNDFRRKVDFPNDLIVYESDVVLVYLLEDVVNGFDVWSQLPQIYFLNQGTLLYTFEHTFVDVDIFLDANFNLNSLDPVFTDDQIFRIAVLPAEYANADLSMDELMSNLQIETSDIEILSN
ncbi:MAG: collagen-like protein [Flavobacteriaceae bacterium]|nr:collagen-like protein [Flavobacteriaceae bacterium]